MAAPMTSTALLGSKASNGPVATLLAIGSGQTGTMGNCLHMSSCPRQSFQSCVRTNVAKSSPGVMVSSATALRFGKKDSESRFQQASEAPEISKEKLQEAEEMKHYIEDIRAMFRRMTEGEITVSPWDTAWVARVPAFDGSGGPQFPTSLQWILDNQLADGSWGMSDYFSYIDRVNNTLACIVVLKTWNTRSAAIERGEKFLQENIHAMETEEKSHLLIGFEIVFPPLMSAAQKLGLDLPYDDPFISTISAIRKKKLDRIPMELVYKVPTNLLYSLEGIHDEVDWDKLMKFQEASGAFTFSPASTAACLLHTRNEKALGYLNRLVARFNNAVPNVYPVDLFERMWMVDRLQRLGIDRHFEKEIKVCLDYVYKYCNMSNGMACASGSALPDADDTAMGFRLLRLHGYDVSADAFRPYCNEQNEFFAYLGHVGDFGPTGFFNLYRAGQTRFPGETILEAAEKFAQHGLEEKLEKNDFTDKWVIPNDLAGEVEYALQTPWYCSLPLMETESYLKQYGTDDVWIGKVLYRMGHVHNEKFLALAKADFNLCQAQYQQDLQEIARWNEDCAFGKLTLTREKLYEAFFSAACVFPYPELARARLVWTRQCVLTTVVHDFFDTEATLPDLRKFVAAAREWDPSLMDGTAKEAQMVFSGLYNSINAISEEGLLAQGRDISQHLKTSWLRWLASILTEAEWTASGFGPSFAEYMETALSSIPLEPIVLSTVFFLGEPVSDELVNDSKKLQLMDLVNHVGRFLHDIQVQKRDESEGKANAVSILLRTNPKWTEEEAISIVKAIVEESMQQLVREVHSQSHIPKSVRQAHFNMARVLQLFYQKARSFSDFSTRMAKKMENLPFKDEL